MVDRADDQPRAGSVDRALAEGFPQSVSRRSHGGLGLFQLSKGSL